MSFVENRNPRFQRFFPVTLHFDNYIIIGQVSTPSAFGGSVEISLYAYEHLQKNPALWEKYRSIKAVTAVNDLPAAVNGFFARHDKHFLSVKLLENRSWYK